MRKQLDEFVTSTTIHGINKAGNASWRRRRFVWLLLTLLMTCALIAFIVEAITIFLQYRTVTRISAENKQNLEFPAVTICNMNMVKRTIPQCNGTVFANLDKVFLNFGETLVIEDRLTPGMGFVKGLLPSGEQMLDCLYQYSNTIEEMLPICTWNGALEPCSNLFKTTMTEMGVCFTFNGEANQRQHSSFTGSDSGLRVFVDIRQEDYYYSATIQAGIKVVLHEPMEAPLPSLGGFMVAPGLSADAVVLRTKKSSLGEPYGSCLNVQGAGNPLLRYPVYSEKACRMECMVNYLVSKNDICKNCRHFLYPGPERLCDYEELEQCFQFYRNATTERYSSDCRCQRPCDTVQYDTSISYAGFMSEFMYNYFLTKGIFPTPEYGRNNFIELKIYYDSLIEAVITESPEFDIYQILSNIGGLMGIFLGASLLSVVELMEFLVLTLMPRSKLKTGDVPDAENGTVTAPGDRTKQVAVIKERKRMINVKTDTRNLKKKRNQRRF